MVEDQLFNTSLKNAMALCAGREMCRHDIRQKLISRGLKDDKIDKILNLLTEGKFISEERYAIAFTKDKFRYNKWGKLKIGAGLRMKKINDEIIVKALDSIDETEYVDLLKSIISKQQKIVKAKNQFDLKGKIHRHCLSKGFESHLIYELLGEVAG
jgi:regulatory protein